MSSEKSLTSGDTVKGRILAEHRQLDILFEDARDAFRGTESSSSATPAFEELRESLETHFDQEEHLYYPAIWALRPELKPGLQKFVAEHVKFRSMIENIEAMLAGGEFERCGGAIEELASGFGHHEAGEESVLRNLNLELENAE